MTDLDKGLIMLKSPNPSIRYEGCEELRLATESSPEVILALEEATEDENEDVAERAIQALLAEVHHQMAIQMGKNLAIYEPQPRPEIESKYEKTNWGQAALVLLILGLLIGAYGLCYLSFLYGYNDPSWKIPTSTLIQGWAPLLAGLLLGLASVIFWIRAGTQTGRQPSTKKRK